MRLCLRGDSDCTSAIVLSRSKIQYAATANMKKMPTSASNAVFVTVSAGWTSALPEGSLQPLVDAAQDRVLDPGRMHGFVMDARRPDRLLDLVDRRRHDQPEEE